MKRVNRADFLRRIESVISGVTPKEGEIQSNCLVFRGGLVQSYNGEISASFDSTLGDEVTGAVQAQKLVSYIQRLTIDEIEITGGTSEFRVASGKETAGFPMENEILLPVDSVTPPTEWKPLAEGFLEAVNIVQQCTTEDKKASFITTVVHIAPKWLEASDGVQVIRYRIPTPIKTPVLIRQTAIKNIVSLGVSEFAETPTWTHFRNAENLIYSCHCFTDEYPSVSVTEVLQSDDGEPAALPKGLIDIATRALIFSEKSKVWVDIGAGFLRVKGQGTRGEWFDSGKVPVVYSGGELSFLISPKLLGELAEKYNDVYVSERLLKIIGSGWKYATVLGIDANESQGGADEEPVEETADEAQGEYAAVEE